MSQHESTQVLTEALTTEALAAAQERLRKMSPPATPPQAPAVPAPSLTLTPDPEPRTRNAGRGPGGKGVLLQLSAEQYAKLEAKAKADRRDVTNYIRLCVDDNFDAFIELK